jgi:hypothetical protein
MAKIGENALSEAFVQGVEELRNANAGAMAMDAPPIVQAEAPVVEQASYADLLNRQAEMAEGRGDAPDQGMSR